MRKDFELFNPENFKPEVFMHPPTEIVSDELTYLNKKLEQTIKGHIPKRHIQVGSEFEVLFFDPLEHPYHVLEKFGNSPRKNRNYSSKHKNKIKEISNIGSALKEKYPKNFIDHTQFGSLMIEFRTAPQDIEGYHESINILADTLRTNTARLDVLPVVYSQHIHITTKNSLLSRITGFNKIGTVDYCNYNHKKLASTFNHVLPLVLLPEEYQSAIRNRCVQVKQSPFSHPEFRMLSSEWANDPILNLNLSLRAIYATFINPRSTTRLNLVPKTYEDSVLVLSRDRELATFFGQSTLDTLSQIVSKYPAVQIGRIGLEQIHNKVKTA